MLLSGKVSVVTGGGKGIGKAIARDLAMEGSKVLICGRNEMFLSKATQQISDEGGICSYIVADVLKFEDVLKVVSFTLKTYGSIDVLINNSGVGGFGVLESFTPEEYDQIMNTNVKGSFLMMHEVIPLMKKQGSGHIIIISSDLAARVAENVAVYSASKHAQHALAAAVRKEVRPFGIKIGEIRPGLTDTYFNNSQPGEKAKEDWLMPSDVSQAVMYMLKAPYHVMVDEITLHPMIQDDY